MKERKTYFLYGSGKPLDRLTLGTLVAKDYANPTTTGHCLYRLLR